MLWPKIYKNGYILPVSLFKQGGDEHAIMPVDGSHPTDPQQILPFEFEYGWVVGQ